MLAGQHGGGDIFPPPPPAPPTVPEWEAADAPLDEYDFCDCPGPPPPPKFVIPPPPPSPSSSVCRGAGHSPSEGTPLLQFCHLEPVGAEFTQTAFPSLPIIAVCSSVVLVAVLVASFLLWKHKRKVQNFLPCKSQGRCDMPVGPAGGITYDDVLINHHPTRIPNHHHAASPHLTDTTGLTPIELLDVKYGNYIQQHPDPLTRSNFPLAGSNKDYQGVVCSGSEQLHRQTLQHHQHHRQHPQNQQTRGHHPHNPSNHKKKKDHFHPIYEEVSAASDEKIKAGQHSYDSDIEDSEIEGRTVASEDEFAEDELSVAGEYQPSLNPPDDEEEDEDEEEDVEGVENDQSATSSLRGSTGGDLYPDLVSGSNNQFRDNDQSIVSATSENKGLKNVFRGLELGNALKKHTHSLERNKDGHPSNSFQAKQNYYLNKSMLGPDFTQSCDTPQTNSPDIVAQSTLDSCVYPCSRTIGSSLNFIPMLQQQQQQQQQQQRSSLTSRSAANSPPPPPYAACTGTARHHGNHGGGSGSQNREIISALYNPHVVSPTMSSGRLPDAVLREMAFKMAGESSSVASLASAVGAMSSRSLPVPPSCRSSGSTVLYPMDNTYPLPPASMMSGACRARSGSATEFGYHPAYGQQQYNVGGGRPPTPPPPENIYASIDDDGPFTIDGSRYRGSSSFVPSGRKGSSEFRNTFGKSRTLAAKSGTDKKNNKSSSDSRHPDEKSGSYGDIRSSYDSRTACS